MEKSGSAITGDKQIRAAVCWECGAAILPGATCRDHFHALLALEWEIPDSPGEIAHFYAVAAYGLQHPQDMGYTVAAVNGLRTAVRDMLAGNTTLAEVRNRVREEVRRAGRVTRRENEPIPRGIEPPGSSGAWPMTVVDVLEGGVVGYGERVEEWARTILATVDGVNPDERG